MTRWSRRARQERYSDALARLAASLQRLNMTMTGIERLSPEAMHAIADVLDRVPDQVAVHQPRPPHGNTERNRPSPRS